VTVLLVDDYPDALDVWEIFLTAAGCGVMTASDGAQALAIARASLPDVIAMDLQMPGLSGASVAQELRSDPSTAHIPLVAVTGRRLDPAEVRSMGFVSLVVKPCEPDALLAELRRVAAIGGSAESVE
jgi:CheY-like chemotaxis protein